MFILNIPNLHRLKLDFFLTAVTAQTAQKLQIPVSFHVMFMINITWNETGIFSFGAVWAVRAVGKNQVLTCASLVC